MGLQSAFSGAKRWEEKQPVAALSLLELAESHAQQDPTFKTSLAYTRAYCSIRIETTQRAGI